MDQNSELKPKIIVDSREFRCNVVKELVLKGAEIQQTQLEVGDFIVSDRVAVERKIGLDFINSVLSGRIFDQLFDLKNSFEKPILIIENPNFASRNVHPNAVYGALASISVDIGVPIIWTKNEEETAGFLLQVAKREQFDLKKSISIRGCRTTMSLPELQEFIVSGLPNINAKLSERLLKKFKTVKKVMTASEDRLKKVEGIGKKKAEKIIEVINSEYTK